MITKTCRVSGKEFEITAEDLEFYAKMGIISEEDLAKLKSREITDCAGLPTLCPEERQRRRLAWRNERKLYRRKCDLCQKQIISIYDENAEFPVYCKDCWWSDKWEAQKFSRGFDFSRPFFEQFAELQKKVPKLCLIFENNENCEYVHLVGDSRNCYLIFGSAGCEDCLYGSPYFSRDCVDTLAIQNSEMCYECLDSDKLYNCTYCQNCVNSNDLHYCYDVQGSHDCLACVGLRKSEYYILNKKYSRENYEKIIKTIHQPNVRVKILQEFKKLKLSIPHKFMNGVFNENVSGDYLFQCKNSHNAFNCKECEDMTRATQITKSKDVFDTDYGEYAELIYENNGYFRINNCSFCHWNWVNSSNLLYCSNCSRNVKDCFGCIGLRNSQYCILNKQYSKEEYFKTREKIIEHMKTFHSPYVSLIEEDGVRGASGGVEWGEFFPANISPFAYNETVAQEYFPLTKEAILKRKCKWREEKQSVQYTGPEYKIPENIKDVPDDIVSKVLKCKKSGKFYRIQKQELQFYRKMGLPIPRLHPEERHIERLKLRNPRKLFSRKCDNCGKDIQTTFAPDRPEKVLCEDCYLKVVD